VFLPKHDFLFEAFHPNVKNVISCTGHLFLIFFLGCLKSLAFPSFVPSSDIFLLGQNFVSVPDITCAFVGFANE